MPEQIPEKMQAVVCHGPHDYRLEDVAVPRRGPGEALVKVEAVGICASDLKCYHGAAKFWGDENRPAWAETMVIPGPVSYTHLTLPTTCTRCRSRWSPYH